MNSRIRYKVWARLGAEMWDATHSKIEGEVWDEVRDKIWDEVGQVESSLLDVVKSKIQVKL